VPDTRSPVQHHLVLHRIDPEQSVARFYSLMIERDLFGRVVLVRAGEIEAGKVLEVFAAVKRRRGYRDL
jgi:hypothetical protein